MARGRHRRSRPPPARRGRRRCRRPAPWRPRRRTVSRCPRRSRGRRRSRSLPCPAVASRLLPSPLPIQAAAAHGVKRSGVHAGAWRPGPRSAQTPPGTGDAPQRFGPRWSITQNDGAAMPSPATARGTCRGSAWFLAIAIPLLTLARRRQRPTSRWVPTSRRRDGASSGEGKPANRFAGHPDGSIEVMSSSSVSRLYRPVEADLKATPSSPGAGGSTRACRPPTSPRRARTIPPSRSMSAFPGIPSARRSPSA